MTQPAVAVLGAHLSPAAEAGVRLPTRPRHPVHDRAGTGCRAKTVCDPFVGNDTYWYLTGIPELMAIAAERFERFACAEEGSGS